MIKRAAFLLFCLAVNQINSSILPETIKYETVKYVDSEAQSAVQPIELSDNAVVEQNNAHARFYNLAIGVIESGSTVLHSVRVEKTGVANTFQSEDILYLGNATTRIVAIRAYEMAMGMSQNANAILVNGGVNHNFATVRMLSALGGGYDFMIDIWGF